MCAPSAPPNNGMPIRSMSATKPLLPSQHTEPITLVIPPQDTARKIRSNKYHIRKHTRKTDLSTITRRHSVHEISRRINLEDEDVTSLPKVEKRKSVKLIVTQPTNPETNNDEEEDVFIIDPATLLSKQEVEKLDDAASLHYFVEKNLVQDFTSYVQELAKHLEVVNVNDNYRDDQKNKASLLHKCAQFQRIKIMEQLFDLAANPNCEDKSEATPIFYAAAVGSLRATVSLLKNHARVNIKDKYDSTPLAVALRNQNYEIAEMLLLLSADIHFKLVKSETVLHIACKEGNLQKVNFLMEHGASSKSHIDQ
jgi:hypothetical protein